MATNYVTQLYDHFLGDQVVDVEPTTALRHCLVLMLGCPVLFGVALHFRDALKRLTCGNAYLAVYLFGSVQLVLTYFRTEAAHALGHSDLLGDLLPPFPAAVATAVALAGQALNFLVYYRLGPVGVYYGNAFGIDLPWCTEFPFGKNGLPHPQYLGATLSTIGVAMKTGKTTAYLAILFTIICYTIVIPVERSYFAHIDEQRKKRVSKKE